MRLHPEDLEALGWALFLSMPAMQEADSLLDQIDKSYAARIAGRAAGEAGQPLGENPAGCPACKREWAAGWEQGHALFLNRGTVLVALH